MPSLSTSLKPHRSNRRDRTITTPSLPASASQSNDRRFTESSDSGFQTLLNGKAVAMLIKAMPSIPGSKANRPSGVSSQWQRGRGKTLTALICATRCQDRLGDRPLLVVVSAPSVPLIIQWSDEVRKFGVSAITPSLARDSKRELTRLFRGLRSGGTHVVIVTNNLLCTPAFQKTLEKKLQTRSGMIATLLIGDEAHTLGAESFIRNKPGFFERRLALSATPERQYDPDGTEQIFQFFGPTVYEFGLDRAIGFCLVPYRYYVHACTLDGDELDEFDALSRRIGAAMAVEADDDEESPLQALLIARRRIVETATSKIDLLHTVLERRQPRDLAHALIYASAKNPEQFDRIGSLLNELDVKWAPVTQETTKNPSRLARILDSFSKGAIQVLLAKKVLDEGVDIPTIREAFIVASSTVEREWVQRRGRVLRMHPGKAVGNRSRFRCAAAGTIGST